MSHTESTNRRSLLKAAAWTAPAVAVAVSAPAAAASGGVVSVGWLAPVASQAPLHILESDDSLTPNSPVTVPDTLRIVNDTNAEISATRFTVTVGRPNPNGTVDGPYGRGFGVYSIGGVPTPDGTHFRSYFNNPPHGRYGFPETYYIGMPSITVPANTTLDIAVVFGLSGLSTFPPGDVLGGLRRVDARLEIGASSYSFPVTTIDVPDNAGIL